MIWNSILAMTVIDVLIILTTVFVAIDLKRNYRMVKDLGLTAGANSIFVGMALLALFYASDLVVMYAIPLSTPHSESMLVMTNLHLNLSWINTLGSMLFIAFGISYLMRNLIPRVKFSIEEFEEKAAHHTAKLEGQSASLQAVLDSLPVEISVRDVEGRHTLVNAAWKSVFNTRGNDPIGRFVGSLYPENFANRLQQVHKDVLQSNSGITFEEALWNSEGDQQTFLGTSAPVYDEAGRLIGISTTSMNISRRKQMEKAEREQRTLAEALSNTVATINTSLNLDEVLEQILGSVERVVPHDAAIILLAKAGMAQVARSRGYAERGMSDWITSITFSIEDTPNLWHMAKTGQPVLIPNVGSSADWISYPETRWIKSNLGAPIQHEGEILGFLSLESATSNAFEENQIAHLQAFANQAALAIHNAQIFEAERKQRALAEALSDTAIVLNSTLDLDEVLDHILDSVGKVVPHDAANIMLVDSEKAHFVRTRGYDKHGSQTFALSETAFQIADFPNMQQVVETKQAILITDTRADPKWIQRAESKWIRSFIGCPIQLNEDVIGLVNLDSAEPDFFTEDHVNQLRAFSHQAATAIQNARLHEDSRERARRLELVGQVGRRVTAILDLDKVLHETITLIRDFFGYYHATVGLIDGNDVVLSATTHSRLQHLEGVHRLKIGPDSIVGWVADQGTPLLVPDVRSDSRYVDPKSANDDTTLSELAVPIKFEKDVMGILDIQSSELYHFSDIDVFTLQTIADQLAIAIRNAQLHAAAQNRNTTLRLIADIGKQTTAILQLDDLLPAAAHLISDTFGYYSTQIALVEGEYVVLRAATRSEFSRLAGQLRSRLGEESIAGWVAGNGKPLLVADVTKEPRFQFTKEARETRSEMTVPIKLQDKVVGIIDVQSDKLNDFSKDDISILKTIADQLAAPIDNARLYDTIRRHAEELEERVTQRTAELRLTNEQLIAEIAERELVEEALRKSERSLADAQAVAKIGSWEWDVLADKIQWSDEMYRIHGVESDIEPSIALVRQLIHTDDRAAFEQALASINEGVDSNPIGYRIIAEDGTTRFIHSIAEVFRDSQRNPVRIVGTSQDITERKKIEQELRESEEKYRLLVESTSDWIWSTDSEGRHTFSNNAISQLLGYQVSETVGKLAFEFMHPDDKPSIQKMVRSASKNNTGWKDLAIRWMHKDGTVRYFSSTAQPRLNSEGRLVGFSGIDRDVTERVQMEEALRMSLEKSTELYSTAREIGLAQTIAEVLEAMMANNALTQADRATILLFDAPWQDEPPETVHIAAVWGIHGLAAQSDDAIGSSRSMKGHPLVPVLPKDKVIVISDIESDTRLDDEGRRALRKSEFASLITFKLVASGNFFGLVSIQSKSGFNMSLADIWYIQGLVDQAAVAIHNIRSLQAEAEARKEAEAADEMKRNFLAMISHELRTPLASIKGFATTLMAEDVVWGVEMQRDFIETINDEANKLTDLIGQLLDLSRLEAGTLQINPQYQSLEAVISTVLAEIQIITANHKLELSLPKDMPFATYDIRRIAQVLINLVDNATKYAPAGSTVILSVDPYADSEFVRINVADEGPGIAAELQDQVFEMFYREEIVARQKPGAGLGLAICKGLITAHGGEIWVEDVKRGTSISFTLPARPKGRE